MVQCPICGKSVKQTNINNHIDSNCLQDVESDKPPSVPGVFRTPAKRDASAAFFSSSQPVRSSPSLTDTQPASISLKRSFESVSTNHTNGASHSEGTRKSEDVDVRNGLSHPHHGSHNPASSANPPPPKKPRLSALDKAAPLAERMRPRTLSEISGQDLVGPNGILRGLIEADRVPSMILWGGAGTGKTTIARVIANMVGSRFVEINSANSGVGEVKKIFGEARSELSLTGRKTIIFCDEIHRFSKSQQDVFLAPVEAGLVTLIAATTENPSFKVQNALLSRCRTFTLSKLTETDVVKILDRALAKETESDRYTPSELVDGDLLKYLAAFADGDARTALNLLELVMELSQRKDMTLERLKESLTKTLVYDRAGDQHYDTISAFHKSVRGGDADAALYYLARMIQSGEDALYIARRMIVIASEDVGLADNSMLPLATAAYTAAEKVGLPEARINLAHVTVALCHAPKSTRAYRGLANAMHALQEPGVAGLPIPVHLRNAPTRLMKELGYGKEYKYNPDYVGGRVKQEYLPDKLRGKAFLEDADFGDKVDGDLIGEKNSINHIGMANGLDAPEGTEIG